MGPNVKFVSATTDAFSNRKNGGQFFSGKRPNRGGTVGQEAVELICQSERKTQQNATISL